MDAVRNAGIMTLASMLVCVFPLAMAMTYAIWPTEQRLTLVRTLSLAGVFSSVAGTALGFVNELVYVANRRPESFSPVVAHGTAESLVPLFFGFGCLTATWLCVTIGLWRRSAVPE